MKDHNGDTKQFTHLSRAWYGATNLRSADFFDRVMFGFYSPDGGTSGEIEMRWVDIKGPTAQLRAFEDSWHTLGQLKDVIDRLAESEGQNIGPLQFCKILVECGFEDITEEKSPYADDALAAERQEYERLRAKFGG